MRPNRGTVAATATALALVLTACGGDDAATRSAAEPQVSVAATTGGASSAASTPGKLGDGVDSLDSLFADGKQAEFTGAAADTFGKETVGQAYEQLVKFSLREGYDETLLRTEKPQPVQFTAVKKHLTEGASEYLDQSLAAAINGDRDARNNVYMLAFYDITAESPYELPAEGEPLISNLQFSPAQTAVDATTGRDRLAMSFETSVDISALKDGAPVTVRMTKKHTYWVVPTGQAEMRVAIDSWEGSFQAQEVSAG